MITTSVTLTGHPRELATALAGLRPADVTVACDNGLLAGAADELFERGFTVRDEHHEPRVVGVRLSHIADVEIAALDPGARERVLDVGAHAIEAELAYLYRRRRIAAV